MSPSPPRDWFLVDERPIEGLGHGTLLQSSLSPSDFQASLILNSYESNCLRDWLSQRWLAKSLEQTCVFNSDHSRLIISKNISAGNLHDAKEKFRLWIQAVLSDRTKAAQSRV
jgi:hypothetical protein